MTTRDYIEKRNKLIVRVEILWAVVMVSAAIGLKKLRGPLLMEVFVLWMLVMLALAPVIRWFSRCPRCGGVLLLPILGKPKPIPNHCPYCAVSLDEPMP